MMAIDGESTLTDVCFTICTALEHVGVTAVLTGGSAAAVYAPTVYQSRDADFIVTMHAAGGAEALSELGYVEKGGTYFHRLSPFTLEFPHGPLAVGDDLITAWETLRKDGLVLHILSRTDSVRDRLMWFYLDNDRSALRAAVGVAKSGLFDEEIVRDWSEREGFPRQHALFLEGMK